VLSTHRRFGYSKAATLTSPTFASANLSQALIQRPRHAEGSDVAQAPVVGKASGELGLLRLVKVGSVHLSRAELFWSFEKNSVSLLASVSPDTRDTMAANVCDYV
jgi:hypothetical protein